METHPIPRQITTFEFKLIGFMTVKQFGFVLLSGVFGYLFFLAIPIQIVNIVVGVLVLSVGLLFAFVPINDRPMDVFVKNLLRRINSPTQYTFQKHNDPPAVFDNLYFDQDPHVVIAHVESKEKLNAYTQTKQAPPEDVQEERSHKSRIHDLFHAKPIPHRSPDTTQQNGHPPKPLQKNTISKTNPPQSASVKHPVFSGVVYNTRKIPLPGVLIYIRDVATNKPLRILKTNPHGVFATFQPLPDGAYVVELNDPSKNYVFETKTITIHNDSHSNFEFVSKELV